MPNVHSAIPAGRFFFLLVRRECGIDPSNQDLIRIGGWWALSCVTGSPRGDMDDEGEAGRGSPDSRSTLSV